MSGLPQNEISLEYLDKPLISHVINPANDTESLDPGQYVKAVDRLFFRTIERS